MNGVVRGFVLIDKWTAETIAPERFRSLLCSVYGTEAERVTDCTYAVEGTIANEWRLFDTDDRVLVEWTVAPKDQFHQHEAQALEVVRLLCQEVPPRRIKHDDDIHPLATPQAGR